MFLYGTAEWHCMMQAGGEVFNQIFLELCFAVTLQDERGEGVLIKCPCSLAFVCRTTTLYDERQKVSEQ